MTKRRAPTPRQVLRIIIAQGGVVPCALCPDPITAEEAKSAIREHLHAFGLGGSDDLEGQAFVHGDCAKRKTTGRAGTSKNSSAGDGDVSRISKVARLRGETGTGPKKAIAARANPWPKGRRLQSRPFEKRRAVT